jgi:hypothetical protein
MKPRVSQPMDGLGNLPLVALLTTAGAITAAAAIAVTVGVWRRCFEALDVFAVVAAGLGLG